MARKILFLSVNGVHLIALYENKKFLHAKELFLF
jgi:hypothetical protein